MPEGTYGDPVWVVRKHYGFWWFVGAVLSFVIRCIVWIVVWTIFCCTWLWWALYFKNDEDGNGEADPRGKGYNISDRR